jgi:hypothetical protein
MPRATTRRPAVLWQEALAIEEAVLGRRHRETAVTLHVLGKVAYAEGDYCFVMLDFVLLQPDTDA